MQEFYFRSSKGSKKKGFLLTDVKENHFAGVNDERFKTILFNHQLINQDGWPDDVAIQFDYLRVIPKISETKDQISPKGFNLVATNDGIEILKTMKKAMLEFKNPEPKKKPKKSKNKSRIANEIN